MSTATMSPNFARNTNGQARTPNPYTPRQLQFLVDLVAQIGAYDKERGHAIWAEMRQLQQSGGLTFNVASSKINELKAERNELRQAQIVDPREDRAAPVEEPKLPLLVPEGRYAVNTDEGHLAFYQVKVDKQGVVSVHLQTSDELHKLPYKTAMGVMGKIDVDGIETAMKRYGKELRICGAPMCGRTLTNEESRKRGIGPKCATKMGF